VTPRTARETGTVTLTEAGVLALLEIEGERSGYDLLKLSQKAISQVWTPARSHLYAVLPRLVELGYASVRHVNQDHRPDKQLYSITPAGRSALETWLEEVIPGATDSFYLKLFVGLLSSDDVTVRHVEQYRRDVAARLAKLRELEKTNTRTGHDRYHWFLLRLGLDEYEHRLEWADWVLGELRG
jgi:PadR family transcriptional regulator AphA